MTAAAHRSDNATTPAEIRTLMDRVRAEYAEMPGLSVTLRQAQRLFAVDRATCERVFTRLIRTGALRLTTRGGFVRRDTTGGEPMELPIEMFVQGGRTETADALRDYAVRRLSFAVRRFRHRIRRITVRLVDENGPRGGVDARCSITAELLDGEQRFVKATAARPFVAITQAASRLSEGLRRTLNRRSF